MNDKRKHMRLSITMPCEIEIKNQMRLSGETKNMSFGGVYVELYDEFDFSKDNELDFILNLNGKSGLAIRFRCRVAHICHAGVGLKFVMIFGLDGYDHFKNIMIMNSDDPNQLLEELKKNPGIIVE